MGYVGAVPLDGWLAMARPDIRAILMTFAGICDAVQRAHQPRGTDRSGSACLPVIGLPERQRRDSEDGVIR